MKNQYYTGTPTSRRQVVLPTAVTAGMPILVGDIPMVALDNYQTASDGATCLANGSFLLTVIAASQVSPLVGAAINPGDAIYATGTLDSATNVTYNLTLSATTTDTFFGRLDPSAPAIGSGDTDTAAIVVIGERP